MDHIQNCKWTKSFLLNCQDYWDITLDIHECCRNIGYFHLQGPSKETLWCPISSGMVQSTFPPLRGVISTLIEYWSHLYLSNNPILNRLGVYSYLTPYIYWHVGCWRLFTDARDNFILRVYRDVPILSSCPDNWTGWWLGPPFHDIASALTTLSQIIIEMLCCKKIFFLVC